MKLNFDAGKSTGYGSSHRTINLVLAAVFVVAASSYGCVKKKAESAKGSAESAKKTEDEDGEGDGSKAARKEPKKKGTGPFLKTLRAKEGMKGDVTILAGKSGLWAVSKDGKAKHKVYDGPVSWAVVDNKLRVVWMIRPKGKKWTLELIDFDGPGEPETVLESFPGAPIEIVHQDGKLTAGDENYAIAYALILKEGKVKLETRGGNYDFADRAKPLEAAGKKLAVANPERVKALLRRSKGRAVQPKTPDAPEAKRVDVDKSNCQARDLCGTASVIPGTPYWKVITEHSCGDGCHVTTMLYDPRSKEFFCSSDPKLRGKTPKSEWSGVDAAWVAPSGEAYSDGYTVYSFKTGLVTDVEPLQEEKPDEWRLGGGWLGGGWRMDE
jgi:hypothetical protein